MTAAREPPAGPVFVCMDVPEQPFLVRDAKKFGLGRRRRERLQADGVLVQPVRGVLMRADDEADPVVRAAAIGLALPEGAAVCGPVAAWLHGVDPRAPWQRNDPLTLECVVPRGCEPCDLPGVVSHVDLLDPADVVAVDGLPVTSVERTALDAARTLAPHMALAVLDAMARRAMVDPEVLAVRIEEWRRRRGVAQARRLIALCDGRSESFGESWLRLRLIDAGFPGAEPQIWIFDENGVALYRLDLGWPELKIGVEYDGLEFHETPEQRRHDIARRDELPDRFGWNVVGVDRGEVLGRSLTLERGVGAMLGLAPQITRRLW